MKTQHFIYAITLLAFVSHFDGVAQYRHTVPPTPNAMKMTEYYGQRPNMYTGTANVSIPLYTIPFAGWDLPLSVSHNATGIRTNEDASEVGQGWALNATGVISRTIRGGDDLYEGAQGGGTGEGYCYNRRPVTTEMGFNYPAQIEPHDTSYYYYLVHTRPDTEPDVFNYNFFGYSGSFVLTQKVSSGNVINILKLTEDATVIKINEGAKTFQIITPEGFKGEFTVKEKSTTLSAAVNTIDRMECCAVNNINIADFVAQSGRFRTTTSWYLSKITSPHGEEINFSYDLVNDKSPYISKTISFSEKKNILAIEACLQTIHEHIYLKQIQSDEVQIDFAMENRDDVRKNDLFLNPYVEGNPNYSSWPYFNSGLALRRYTGFIVKARSNNAIVRSVDFKQSYFNGLHYRDWDGVTEQEAQMLRGRLDRLLIDDQEYRFTYENGNNGVPNKLTRGIDHFGFYNGQDNVVSVLPPEFLEINCIDGASSDNIYSQQWDRRAIFDFGKAGLLNKVIYPTRGYTKFFYEAHRYLPRTGVSFRENPGAKDAGGARIASIEDYNYDDVLARKKIYRYVENTDEGFPQPAEVNPTGKLMTELYNRYTHDFLNHDDCKFMYATNTSIPGNNAAEGKVIGYSKVHEFVIGQGNERYRNTYYFENTPMEVTNYNTYAEGDANLNGELKHTVNYNADGDIVQVATNTNYRNELGTVLGLSYSINSGELQFITSEEFSPIYIEFWGHYKLTRSFHTPRTVKVSTSAISPGNMTINAAGELQPGATVTETIKQLGYTDKFLLQFESFTNSKNETMWSTFKRPNDFATNTGVIGHMKNPDNNLVNAVIEQTVLRDGLVVAAKGNKYDFTSPGKVNLVASYSYNRDLGAYSGSTDGMTFTTPYEVDVEYLQYNSLGRPLEIKASDGIVQSFVWDYQGRLPVAAAVGASYASLLSAHTSAAGNEIALRANPLVSGAKVTTYKHAPLVGVTEITDPTARKVEYVYDNYQRLSKIKDNDGNTVEQYKYNFKYLPLTRVLSVSANLNFGSFYACSGIQKRTITIANNGNDNLRVMYVSLPSQFSHEAIFNPVMIGPGESIPVTIYFSETVPGSYSNGYVTIRSNKTEPAGIEGQYTDYQVPISATLIAPGVNRTMWLSKTEVIAPTTEPHEVTIRNDGNACMEVIGVTGLPPEWNIAWGVGGLPPFTLAPNQSRVVTIRRVQTIQQEHTVTINATNATGSQTILLAPAYTRVMSNLPTTLTIPSVEAASTFYDLTISNSGNDPLTMGTPGISGSQMFSVTYIPSNVVPRKQNGVNGSVTARITFAPNFNFTSQVATITFASNRTNAINHVIEVTSQRTSVKNLTVPSPVTHYGEGTISVQPVVVTSAGNDNVNITSVTWPNTDKWSVDNVPGILGVLPPTGMNTRAISVRKKESEPNEVFTVTVNYDNKSTNFTVKPVRRNVTLSSSSPNFNASNSTLNIIDFEGTSKTETITLTNTAGSQGIKVHETVNIFSITSNDGRFTVKDAATGNALAFPITLNPGASKSITVTYTPTDFSDVQGKQISFTGDMTSGPSHISVGGKRRSVKTMTVQSSVTHDGTTATNVPVTITNTGNDNVTIASITKPSTQNWSIYNEVEIAGAVIPPAPGVNTKIIYIRKLPTEPNDSYTVTLNYDNQQSASFTTKTTRRRLGTSSNSVSFTGFTGTSQSQDITLTNHLGAQGVTVEQDLVIYGLTSNDGRFAVTDPGTGSALSFPITLSPGAGKSIRITYTPTDFNLIQSTISFSSNMTSSNMINGANYINVSGKRDEFYQVGVSTSSVFIKPQVSSGYGYAYVNNTGNVEATVSVSNSNPTHFQVKVYKYIGGISQEVNPNNVSVVAGTSLEIRITTGNGQWTQANGTVTVTPNQGSAYVINLSRNTN